MKKKIQISFETIFKTLSSYPVPFAFLNFHIVRVPVDSFGILRVKTPLRSAGLLERQTVWRQHDKRFPRPYLLPRYEIRHAGRRVLFFQSLSLGPKRYSFRRHSRRVCRFNGRTTARNDAVKRHAFELSQSRRSRGRPSYESSIGFLCIHT